MYGIYITKPTAYLELSGLMYVMRGNVVVSDKTALKEA